MVKQLDLLTIVVGEYLLFGLMMFVNMDPFFNPEDGYLKAISGIRATELESNHLDPIFNIITQMKGAGVLSFVMMILMIRNEMTKNDVLRTGIYFHFFVLLVYGRAAIVQDNKYLNLPMIGFYGGSFFVYSLWFLTEAVKHAGKDTMKRTPASWRRMLSPILFVLVMTPPLLNDFMDPHHDDAGKPQSAWVKTTMPDTITKDDLAIFQSQASAAVCLAFVCSTLEMLAFDRSVERLHWFSQCSAVSTVLYLTVFVRAALDDTGYAYKPAWWMLSLMTTLFLFAQLADIFEWWTDILWHKSIALETAPEQSSEELKKKLK